MITLPKGSLVTVAGMTLSDHNRSAFQDQIEPLKSDNRTVSGKLRRYYIDSKRTVTLSWERLPALDSQTADGEAGRNSMRAFYDSNIDNTFTVTYKEVDINNVQTTVSFTAMIDSYSENLVKRTDNQLWDISLTLVEQ